jgi:endonuclease YncB( thermonuclease family)
MKRPTAGLALALALGGLAQAADELGGPAKVRGPETLAIGGARVRLAGVEAPDATARCATADGEASCEEAATAALETLAATGPVTCTKERRLGHGYFLGLCRTADSTDPAERLLRQGLLQPEAGDLPPSYRAAVEAARASKSGVWSE